MKFKEQGHEAAGGQFFETLGQDFRLSLGKLRKSPAFTLAAVLPLVLGGVVVAMALLGVVATWIPAQRVLAVDPLLLLREE